VVTNQRPANRWRAFLLMDSLLFFLKSVCDADWLGAWVLLQKHQNTCVGSDESGTKTAVIGFRIPRSIMFLTVVAALKLFYLHVLYVVVKLIALKASLCTRALFCLFLAFNLVVRLTDSD